MLIEHFNEPNAEQNYPLPAKERAPNLRPLEFFEPAEAAAALKCSEAWLRDGAATGEFPHAVWGKVQIIFTSVPPQGDCRAT